MRKKTVKKIDLHSKPAKYFFARQRGMSKSEAALSVQVDPRNVNKLENTAVYRAVEKKFFKDELLLQIEMGQIAQELIKNITQDDDRGAKNAAIKIALDKLEPEKVNSEPEERVLVILK